MRTISAAIICTVLGLSLLLAGQTQQDSRQMAAGQLRRAPASNRYSPEANSGLPQGRRYYNGRYFGTINNRYYGPQYGYF